MMERQNNIKSIKRPYILLSVLAILALVLAACAQAASTATTDTIDVVTNPTLGKILVDGQGMTLYVFTKDTPDQSNCDAACQAKWPPLVSSGTPKLGPGVDASLIGSATLSNGENIVTYDHMPLYTFVQDAQPGQVNGEDVNGTWFAVSPDGKPVETTGTSTTAATPVGSITEPTINVATSTTLGQYLVDGNGMTLYVYTKDGPNQSNCNAACLAKWPPLLTNGKPNLGTGITASAISTTRLSNGSMIVTYYGMPLYTYVGDTAAGQTNGVGVGGVWFAIAPDGSLLQLPPSSTPTPSAAPMIPAPSPTP